jgi:hypothetical protein
LLQIHKRSQENLQDQKYRTLGQPIALIGVEFSRAERNIVGFEVEEIVG